MGSYFQITISSPSERRALTLPASAAAPRGAAYQESATAGTAELADGTVPIAGFVTRAVRTTGITVDEVMLVDGVVPITGEPGFIPYTAGNVASMENAEQVDVEGTDYLDSVTGSEALKTEFAFSGGKFKAAVSTNLVEFILTAKPTARESGNVRCVFTRVPGYKKA